MSDRWTAWLHAKTEVRRWPGRGGATAPRDLYSGRCGSRVVDRCSSSVRRSWLAAAARRCARLKSAFGSRGVVTKTRAPFPNHSHIGLPLQVGAERHGLTDKTFIGVCVCARRMTRARRHHLAHVQKASERGEECRADTRFRHAQRASRTALDTGREGRLPRPIWLPAVPQSCRPAGPSTCPTSHAKVS